MQTKVQSKRQRRLVSALRRYVRNPVAFCREQLYEDPCDYQQAIMNSVLRYPRTAVRSGHGVGKTRTAANAAIWYLLMHPYSKVLTTASTWMQVEDYLWPEIKSRVRDASPFVKQALPHVLSTKMNFHSPDTGQKYDEWYAIGFSTDKPANVEGAHGRHILIIFDEAKAILEAIYDAISGAGTTDVRELMISTPGPSTGYFFDAFTRNKKMWNTFHIPSTISPFVSETWINDRREAWGEGSPLYKTRVLGEFADDSDTMLIPIDLIYKAFERGNEDPSIDKEAEECWSLDVARFGEDKTVWILRYGDLIVSICITENRSTTSVVGWASRLVDKAATDRLRGKIDSIGIGSGVFDQFKERGYAVEEVNVGLPARDKEHFANKKAEDYWGLRTRFVDGEIRFHPDIPQKVKDILVQELTGLRYDYTSKGQIKIVDPSKSPNVADALMMNFGKGKPRPGVRLL